MTSFSKTLAEIVSDALTLCGDPNGERFSEADMEREVQSALIDLSETGGFVTATTSFVTVEGRLVYALELGSGDPIPIRVLDVRIPAENRVILPMPADRMDLLGLLSSPGRVSHFCRDLSPYDSLWLLRCPDATEAGKTVQVRYMGVASYPSGGSIDTRVPFTLHKALAYGAAARMLLTGDSTETIKGLKLETEFRRMVREDVNLSTTRERELRPI